MSDRKKFLATTSTFAGISKNNLKVNFGDYLVPDMFSLYADYLEPEWKTFKVLLHTEMAMRGAVSQLNSLAHPPF